MTDPIKSQYDEHPFDPNAKDQNSDYTPGRGDTADPDLKVAWDSHPSFNLPPKDIDEEVYKGPGGQTADDAEDFKVSYEALGTQVNQMLERARGLVTKYEDLKKKVAATEGTVFGQTSTRTQPDTSEDIGGDGVTVSFADDGGYGETDFAKPAREFAAKMNPYQEAALHSVGAALELVGEYIARVNHSGQIYAAADRASAFPPPPPNGVRG